MEDVWVLSQLLLQLLCMLEFFQNKKFERRKQRQETGPLLPWTSLSLCEAASAAATWGRARGGSGERGTPELLVMPSGHWIDNLELPP